MAFKILKEIVSEERLPKRFFRGILDTIRDLRNPDEVLKLFSIRDAVSRKEHFLIIGSLAKAYSLKKHSSGTFIKVLILNGALINDTDSKFRVILFNDCASDAESARLKEGDLLAFYEPSIVSNCSAKYTEESNLFEYQVIFGRQTQDDLLFFFMRKDPEAVFELPVNASVSSEQTKEKKNKNGKVVKKTLKRYSDISYVDVPDVKRNRNDSHSKHSNASKADKAGETKNAKEPTKSSQPIASPKTARTYVTLAPRTDKKTSQGKDVEENISVSVSDENHNSESISKENVKARKCNGENVGSSTTDSRTSCKNVNISIVKSGNSKNKAENIPIFKTFYDYKKLCDAPSFKEINTYAVVKDVLGDPKPCKNNKMSLLLLVTDDSIFPRDFRIHIFHDPAKAITVQKHQILRFHRLKLETSKGILDGRVFNSWDVITFDPSEIDQASSRIKGTSSANKCSFAENEHEIIFELKEWMDSMILADIEQELSKTEKLIQNGCEDLILPADDIPQEVVAPKSSEGIEKYLENIDQNLVTVPELSQLSYNTDCNFVCEVFCFRELDNDRAALIVGDGKICPLKLTSFPLALPNCGTLDDCFSKSAIKQNSLHISVLLKNLTARSVSKQLKNGIEIFISNCKIPKEQKGEKADLVITCDLQVGDILILDHSSKRYLKKFIKKPKIDNNQLKRKCEESTPNCKKAGVSFPSEDLSKKRTLSVNLEKCRFENLNGIKGSSEEEAALSSSFCGPVNDSEVVNRVDDSVKSNSAKAKKKDECDPGELASSQLSTCVTKLKEAKEGNTNARVISATDAPDITKLKTKDKQAFFVCMINTINNKKKVEKQTADVNSLDEILSPMSRRSSLLTSNNETSVITNGTSSLHSSRNLNYSFDTSTSQDFEHLISASVITPPKIRKNVCRALSDVSSETSKSSDETDISGGSSDLRNYVSPQAKFKISPHTLPETSKVSENSIQSKSSVTKAVAAEKKLPSQVQSPSILSSPRNTSCHEKSPPSPSKSKPVELSNETKVQERNDIVKSSVASELQSQEIRKKSSTLEPLSASEQGIGNMRAETSTQKSLPASNQRSQGLKGKVSSQESVSAAKQQNQDIHEKTFSSESLFTCEQQSGDLREKTVSQESLPASAQLNKNTKKKSSPQESLQASEGKSQDIRKETSSQGSILADEQQRLDAKKKSSSQESILQPIRVLRKKTSSQESLSEKEQPSQDMRKKTVSQESLLVSETKSRDMRKKLSPPESSSASELKNRVLRKKSSQAPLAASEQQNRDTRENNASQESFSLKEQPSQNMRRRLRQATAEENKSKEAKKSALNVSIDSKSKNSTDKDRAEISTSLDTSNYSSAKFCSSLAKPPAEAENVDDAATVILNQQHIPHTSTPRKNEKSAYTEAWVKSQIDSYDLDTLSDKSEMEGELDDCYLQTVMMDVIFGQTNDETVINQAKGNVAEKSGVTDPGGNSAANDSRDKNVGSEYFLLKITPTDEETEDFIIVVGFCASGCKRYQLIKSFPGTVDSYVCKNCQGGGNNAKLSLRFAMRLHLVACRTGENVEALLTSPYAELFLGCKIKNFVEDERIRRKILDSLKRLPIHVPMLDENGVAVSQKLVLLLEPKTINKKEQWHVIDFEVPMVFTSVRETPQV